MIDLLINRVKDLYFDLERGNERRARFYQQTQAVTPGAIRLNPSQSAEIGQQMMQQQATQQMQQQPNMGMQQPEMGMQPQPQQPPAPPSLLDQLAARR